MLFILSTVGSLHYLDFFLNMIVLVLKALATTPQLKQQMFATKSLSETWRFLF